MWGFLMSSWQHQTGKHQQMNTSCRTCFPNDFTKNHLNLILHCTPLGGTCFGMDIFQVCWMYRLLCWVRQLLRKTPELKKELRPGHVVQFIYRDAIFTDAMSMGFPCETSRIVRMLSYHVEFPRFLNFPQRPPAFLRATCGNQSSST